MFTDLRQHGHTKWKFDILLRTSLMWMVSERRTWKRRFEEVVRLWTDDEVDLSGRTFAGFLKAVRRACSVMSERLSRRLQSVMLTVDPSVRTIAGRDVFAVDGTSLELPRTRANQEFFCGENVDPDSTDRDTSEWKRTPQMQLTALWHVGLPWAWRTGPGDTNEKKHLRDMIPTLPENALVVADAGFVGFDLWETLIESSTDFVVRVGNNVHLIDDLEETDCDDVVWLCRSHRGAPGIRRDLCGWSEQSSVRLTCSS